MTDRVKSTSLAVALGPQALWNGVRWIIRRPGLLALGALPVVLAAIIIGAALVGLFFASISLADVIREATYSWGDVWSEVLAIGSQVALMLSGALLGVLLFTALALALGEPIYERISKAVHREHEIELVSPSWWRSGGNALKLVVRGIGLAILAFAIGFIPIVGHSLFSR